MSLPGAALAAALAGMLTGCRDGSPGMIPDGLLGRLGVSRDARLLRIATTWPESDRVRLTREFASWAEGGDPARIDWTEIPAGIRFDRLSGRPARFDLVLGGPAVEYMRLARVGVLQSASSDRPEWLTTRRERLALMPDDGAGTSTVALDDPRLSPETLAWLSAQLPPDRWAQGYRALVNLFGKAIAPGWQAGAAAAAVERGEAARTVRRIPTDPLPARTGGGPGSCDWIEGAAVLDGAEHAAIAREFLRFLVERRGATPGNKASQDAPDVADLLGDLLGATLVDAREELVSANRAIATSIGGDVGTARHWLGEPPPWPPASVERLLTRGGDRALAMVEDLATEMAPDAELHLWLVESWLKPGRAVDGELLRELARAADGRLVREPRFRAWLRGEWTAWARQRYRRVARLVNGTDTRAEIAGGGARTSRAQAKDGSSVE